MESLLDVIAVYYSSSYCLLSYSVVALVALAVTKFYKELGFYSNSLYIEKMV